MATDVVKQYLALMARYPASPSTLGVIARWQGDMAAWRERADDAYADVYAKLDRKWGRLMVRGAWRDMPRKLADLWVDANGVSLHALMAIRLCALRWDGGVSTPDRGVGAELTSLAKVASGFARLAELGQPRATWTKHDSDVDVKGRGLVFTIDLHASDRQITDTLVSIAMGALLGVDHTDELWRYLLSDERPRGEAWLRDGTTILRSVDHDLRVRIAKAR